MALNISEPKGERRCLLIQREPFIRRNRHSPVTARQRKITFRRLEQLESDEGQLTF